MFKRARASCDFFNNCNAIIICGNFNDTKNLLSTLISLIEATALIIFLQSYMRGASIKGKIRFQIQKYIFVYFR